MDLELAIAVKNIKPVNPKGTVAICSLWTPIDYLWKIWRQAKPDIFDAPSPFALIGGLYGGGLNIMLRNLHHNPQIDTIILFGKDFSGASHQLSNFFSGKIVRTDQWQDYIFDDGHIEKLEKITIEGPQSTYSMDSLIYPEIFSKKPQVENWTGLSHKDLKERLETFFDNYKPASPPLVRPAGIPLPKPIINTYPSNRFSHVITAETITQAWSELVFKLSRFGNAVSFRNGKQRLELNNLKAVVTNPGRMEQTDFAKINLSSENLLEYKNELIDGSLKHGLTYTYGHRLRTHFNEDLLMQAVSDLSSAGDSRHAYISLWDNNTDIKGHDSPCLVTVFFRKIDDKMHLSALFRSHNASRAWPVNCVGLYGLMEFVCRKLNEKRGQHDVSPPFTPGTLTVTSLSITLDPADFLQVKPIIEEWTSRPYKLSHDPNGFFKIGVDPQAEELVALHYSGDGELLDEYRAKTPQQMNWLLAKAHAVSDISHAIYLGGQLERAWHCLEHGKQYVQDKTKIGD
ncbi:MAG: hypothetical protein LBT62_01970 [Deltaproteobacteria bacterium]|jgi:thymidylate synthase|nr:hypothetical protein [Deltaproteobacteria bacterium]